MPTRIKLLANIVQVRKLASCYHKAPSVFLSQVCLLKQHSSMHTAPCIASHNPYFQRSSLCITVLLLRSSDASAVIIALYCVSKRPPYRCTGAMMHTCARGHVNADTKIGFRFHCQLCYWSERSTVSPKRGCHRRRTGRLPIACFRPL